MRTAVDQTPAEQDRKDVFAANVRTLVDLLQLSQMQEAANRIGVPYKWLWRMASKGIGRVDDRNVPNLQKLADYFRLPTTDDFWRPDLLIWLVSSDEESPFIETFHDNLRDSYYRELGKLSSANIEFVVAAPKALKQVGMEITRIRQRLGSAISDRGAKLDRLVAVGRYGALKQMAEALGTMIDEAYEREFGGGRPDDNREQNKRSATA